MVGGKVLIYSPNNLSKPIASAYVISSFYDFSQIELSKPTGRQWKTGDFVILEKKE